MREERSRYAGIFAFHHAKEIILCRHVCLDPLQPWRGRSRVRRRIPRARIHRGERPDPCHAGAADPPTEEEAESSTMFPHSQTARWWVSGQFNTILQAHPAFHAAYSGPNSLQPQGSRRPPYVETLYLGYQLGHGAEVLLDIESAGGTRRERARWGWPDSPTWMWCAIRIWR